MSDQNNSDEYISEDALPVPGGSSAASPIPFSFAPNVDYFFRFAHDPTKFLRILLNSPNNVRDFTVGERTSPAPSIRFRFQADAAGTSYRVLNSMFFNEDRLLVTANLQQLLANAGGVYFNFRQVRNGIFQFHPTTNGRLVGLDNANVDNNPTVFARATYTPLESEWFITTDPFAPLPPVKPIEEGIYTIHTTRKPTSVIESPLRPTPDSEPFIKAQDGAFTQLWQFVYDPQLNAYQIISYTNECLFAYDSGIPGTPPRQRYRLRFTSRMNQTEASYFTVNPADDGSFTIVSVKYPDQKFDLTLANTDNFTPIQLYQRNEYQAQNWLLKRVM